MARRPPVRQRPHRQLAISPGHRHLAHLLDVDQFLDLPGAAGRATRILPDPEPFEIHIERVHQQQLADQRLPDPQQQLDRLGRLDGPHQPGQHTQHPALGAVRDGARGRGIPEKTAVAGPVRGGEHRRLALEPEDAAIGVRHAGQYAGIVDQVPGREIVGPVHDHVVPTDNLQRIGGREPGVVPFDPGVRIQVEQPGLGGIEFAPAHAARPVENLPLEVRRIHGVEVHQAERSDTGRGEVERHRRPQAATPDHQNPRRLELLLARKPHLGQNHVPAVPHQLGLGQRTDSRGHGPSLPQWRRPH